MSTTRLDLSAWTPELLLRIVLCAIGAAFCAGMGALWGYLYGFREAVRTDYNACIANLVSRSVDNGDLKPGEVAPHMAEWLGVKECRAHADGVYGGEKWQP